MSEDKSKPDTDTLDLLLPLMEKGTAQQLATVDSLDAKVVQVFVAASIVVGLAAAGTALAARGSVWLVGGAVASYLVVAIATAVALAIRSYNTIPDADSLWNEHWSDSPLQIKHGLADALATAFKDNRRMLSFKSRAVQIALGAAGIEAACVGLALLDLVR